MRSALRVAPRLFPLLPQGSPGAELGGGAGGGPQAAASPSAFTTFGSPAPPAAAVAGAAQDAGAFRQVASYFPEEVREGVRRCREGRVVGRLMTAGV